jgi:alkylated DNA repair protein (DNA oxidative demethylase)
MNMTLDLFEALDDDNDSEVPPAVEPLSQGAVILRSFARPVQAELLSDVRDVIARAPLRYLITPGGLRMSVAMTNCGALGWLSDRRGYRYVTVDPTSNAAWPAMPVSFARLAVQAAESAGFPGYLPDACLINRYEPGAKLSLHQDRDERDLGAPIVSVSLGVAAVFLFGGPKRADKPVRVTLRHGDVVVWGGPARLNFHGVMPLADCANSLLGRQRINLTFRKAG